MASIELAENETWMKKRLYSNEYDSIISLTIVDWVNNNYPELGIMSFERNKTVKKLCLNCIVTNLHNAWDKSKMLLVNLNSNKYSSNRSYGLNYFTYDNVINIINALLENKYIELKKGYYDKEKQKGKLSRIWATEKLIDQLVISNEYPFLLLFNDRTLFTSRIKYRDISSEKRFRYCGRNTYEFHKEKYSNFVCP